VLEVTAIDTTAEKSSCKDERKTISSKVEKDMEFAEEETGCNC
jgi:hypothetical protein